jgi:hypothetical protein
LIYFVIHTTLLLTNYTGVYRRAEIIQCKMHMVNSDDTTHWYLLLDTQTFDWPTARPATTNKHGKHTTHCISSHILSLFTKYKYTDNIYSICSVTTAMTLLSLTYWDFYSAVPWTENLQHYAHRLHCTVCRYQHTHVLCSVSIKKSP